MKASISLYPNGTKFISIDYHGDWHDFPHFANSVLQGIHAHSIASPTAGKVVDAHWYEFSWQNGRYRMIFEEWPLQCVIEKLVNVTDMSALHDAISRLNL